VTSLSSQTPPVSAVCFDTSPLIDLNNAGVLDQVAAWFPEGSCFTAPIIINKELPKSLLKHPQNKAIVNAPWLTTVPIEDPADQIFWEKIRREMHTLTRPKGEGEAEVLTLCNRYRWTAVINEPPARRAAAVHKIPCVCTPTLIVAATARGFMTADEGWNMHTHVHAEKEDTRSVLGITTHFRSAFERAVRGVDRWVTIHSHPQWPAIPRGLDEMVAGFAGTLPHRRKRPR
jgi:hypothetical protein